MPSTRHHFYDLNFKLKIVAEVEAVKNNREIAHEYSILESIVRKWRNQQSFVYGRVKDDCEMCLNGFYVIPVFNSYQFMPPSTKCFDCL